MLNFKIIIRTLGYLLVGEGALMLAPLVVSLIYGDGDASSFVVSLLASIVFGLLFIVLTRHAKRDIGKREGYVIVSFVWIFFSLIGCMPFILSESIPSFTDAFFETMSGFTTTGASILENVESLPHGILFWRSMTQWIGGMGIVVLSLAVLPALGIGGMSLFIAEVPGVTYDKLNPKIKDTSKILWNIYLVLTLVLTVLLMFGGMDIFDAICHSFATMSSGGYSTKQASIAYWDSPYIQYVITLFMFLAGVNISLIYSVASGSPKKLFANEEFKTYTFIVLCFTVIITIGLVLTKNMQLEPAFRDSIFQVVSIITTTGFATDDYLTWHSFLAMLLFLAFFIGGTTGSTSGGVKVMRIVLLFKNSFYELRRLIHPNAVIPVRYNNKAVNKSVVTNVLAFFFFYMATLFLCSLIFTLFVGDMETSVSAVASALGNIGPGLGSVGPSSTYLHIAPAGKWFLSFLMMTGRLEIFTVIILFSPSFWKR